MLQGAANFLSDVKAKRRCPWLVLIGASGAGKTHLARKVWSWWCKSGRWFVEERRGANCVHPGHFCLWSDFVNECREGDFSRTETLTGAKLLILDDIAAGADARRWMADKLYMIIEKRLEDEKATFITANLSLEQLAEAYDTRITSRLIRRGVDKVIQVDVQDFNLRGMEACSM